MAEKLESLETICRDIGRLIQGAMPGTGVGFALLMFDFGGGGHLTYVSNAQREDMIKALYECIANLQHGLDQPHVGYGRQQKKG